MSLVIGLLTFVLVINSLFLILLVLIQLPKKEAGAGLAFGGGTTDALFGAGSGNVLTKVTKYATGSFLLLSLVLSVMQTHRAKTSRSDILSAIERKAAAAAVTPSAQKASAAPVIQPNLTNLTGPGLQTTIPAAPKTPATNPVPAEAPGK